MHQILLMTALTATSGLFGGGRSQCASGNCGYVQAPARHYAAPATCAGGSCGTYVAAAPAAPRYYYPTAPAPQAAPAMAAQPTYVAQRPAPRYVNSYYYAPGSTCTSGNCPRY